MYSLCFLQVVRLGSEFAPVANLRCYTSLNLYAVWMNRTLAKCRNQVITRLIMNRANFISTMENRRKRAMLSWKEKRDQSNSKRELTKAINPVSDVMKVGENSDSMEISVRWMEYTFNEFRKAYESYSRSLKDEGDIEECIIHFNEATTRFLSMKDRVSLWNDSGRMQVTQGGAKVRTEDSVSQTSSIGSRASRMSRLSEVILKRSTKERLC